MTPITAFDASTSLLAQLANPAGRALALACIVGLALAALRVKTTSARLFAWTSVLYAALLMPLLGWMLPALPVAMPAFLQSRAAQPAPEPKPIRISHSGASPRLSSAGNEVFIGRNKPVKGPSAGSTILLSSSPFSVSQQPPLSAETPLLGTAPAASQPLSWISSISWNAVAVAIYFVVAILLLARFFVGIVLGRRLMQASRILDEPRAAARLGSRAHAAGLTVTPQLAESEFISVPVTMGALRSTILLPADWREWSDAKLDAVVAHEVSHVARRDALTQRISLLHRAIFWFSPLAWWLDRRLADLAEQASDEAALSCGADRTDYAKTLLGFFEALQAAPGRVWWQGVSMAKSGQAEQRVDRILAWKGAVTMGLKKSIVAVAVALALPVVYLAAAVHPANFNGGTQPVNLSQDQSVPPPPAPRPAPAPKAQANSSPAPVVSPSPEAVPPPETAPAPGASATPYLSPMPAPVAESIPRIGIYGYPPPASMAPIGAMAPMSSMAPRASMAPIGGAMAPLAPVIAGAPIGWGPRQSGTTISGSPANVYSYAFGYDDNQRFVIVTGKSDSLTMSGSEEDAEHVKELRKKIQGDFIWFQHDEKSYIIRDAALIDRAKKLWAPQEELGKKQEELGKQQEALGAQQEALGEKMEQVKVNVPDMTAELDKLKAELKKLSEGGTQEELGDIQSEIGDIQSKIGELQSQAGEKQGDLGRQQGDLGRKQGELGRKQGELGRQQGELARQASRQMKELLNDALSHGQAQPEPEQ
jgi:beta-lactamase regulating signal transducer with metallopeptidase domain